MISPQSDFGALLFQTANECGTDFRKLAETLRERVGEYAKQREEEIYSIPGTFTNSQRADAVQLPAPSQGGAS